MEGLSSESERWCGRGRVGRVILRCVVAVVGSQGGREGVGGNGRGVLLRRDLSGTWQWGVDVDSGSLQPSQHPQRGARRVWG